MIIWRFLVFVFFTLFYFLRYWVATWNANPKEKEAWRGHYLYNYLLKMGPLYIKMGQILATRSDLISDKIAERLRQLQDDVPPMKEADTRKILDDKLPHPLEQIFQDFDFNPVASASIAQVHCGILTTGQKVAVKIIKKDVKKQLQQNIILIKFLLKSIHQLIPSVRSLNLPTRFEELSVLLLTQTDLVHEATQQEAVYLNFKNHSYVKVPSLVPELCNSNIIIMEFVEAIPGKQAHRCQLPPQKLARRFQETIYTMLYLDGLCHGDPHPGNIFFTKEGEIILVDFGITVELSEDEKWGLSSFYYACTRKEWEIAVKRFTNNFVVGTEKIQERWNEYQQDIIQVLRKHFNDKTERWSTISYFQDVNQVLKSYDAQYTTNFTKVELVFLSCEGFATQIDPEIDIWANARKFTDRYSPYMNPQVKEQFNRYFGQKIPQSLALRDRAKNALVAPTHLNRYFFPSSYPLFIQKAQGCHLQDVDNNVYVDLAGGYGPHFLGYNHPEVATTLSKAIHQGGINALGHVPEIELAEIIVDALPNAEKAIFSNSGTEAIIQAIRICRAYRQRNGVAKFEGHYHGFSDQGMVSSWFRFKGSKDKPEAVAGCLGSHSDVVKNTRIFQYGHQPSLQRLREEADKLTCVILEPMPTALANYNRSFLQELRQICTELDLPLIFDEVVSGFRVTYGGVQNLAQVFPDLTCLGKIIGGGLPGGCVAGKQYLIDIAKSSEDPFSDYETKTFVGGTMSGNSLTCSAGIATLKYLKGNPEIYTRLENQTEWLAQKLREIADCRGVSLQVKANYSIFSLTFSYKKAKFYREKQAGSNFKANLALAYYMRKYGVYMPELHTLMLSAAHTQEDLDLVCHGFDSSLRDMVEDGFFVL